MKTHQRDWRWLMLLLLRVNPDREWYTLARSNGIFVNNPPFTERWFHYRYGLWRMHGKPLPIRTTRFRRT
ncbi:MAG: hypothetical protein Q8M08_06620 [Bacteroidales bacterium]|nr:hypothetical protein [Bacteroidales bacterium]